MGFANTELRISELEISNFRRFESLSIDFDQQLTVLVGDNGTGKSTLIDAASIALGTLFHKLNTQRRRRFLPTMLEALLSSKAT